MIPAGLTPPVELDLDDALALLRGGELSVEGRLVDASNATLYCAMTCDGVTAACVYKPVAGERPLWDFPDGTLAEREVAAYEVSTALGWSIVPPTVYRDGPLGPGMVQL
ncbi:MAG: phosphatidylinositol kinase, partial [Pseudonocardiales bacterium]